MDTCAPLPTARYPARAMIAVAAPVSRKPARIFRVGVNRRGRGSTRLNSEANNGTRMIRKSGLRVWIWSGGMGSFRKDRAELAKLLGTPQPMRVSRTVVRNGTEQFT